MPDFLTKTACRGRRPQRFVSARHYRRPDLIAKLLRERHVPRFIVAPEGFGKSFVALEYAETVFRFEHVFWIDAKSPCFLRDLDDGRIAKTLSSEDRAPFLVVVEDVPSLDPQRVELLSREMDALIDRGCEVLVTCLPMRDAFHGQQDRLKLGAADLLLTDAELDALRTAAEREAEPAALMPTARRIATLVWGTPDDRAAFLASVAKEELPADLMLPLFSMLCLQNGALADLAAFGSCEDDSIAILSEQYPYLGIDCRKERFDAASFSMDELSEAFSPTLPGLAERSVFSDADALATHIADALLKREQLARACDAARLLASRKARAVWLASRGRELSDGACLVPACDVYRSLGGEKAGLACALDAAEAARRALLGDRDSACAVARRVSGSSAAAVGLRAAAALVLGRCAEEGERRRAIRLASSLALAPEAAREDDGFLPDADGRSLAAAAAVQDALETSCAEGAKAWLAWYEGGVRGRMMAYAAAWVLSCAELEARTGRSRAEALPSEPVDQVAVVVRARVSTLVQDALRLFDGMAGAGLERACESGAVSVPSLDARSSLAVRRVEMALFSQRADHERIERERAERRFVFSATHPDALSSQSCMPAPSAAIGATPRLTVNLFGGLDVRIGARGSTMRCSGGRRSKRCWRFSCSTGGAILARQTGFAAVAGKARWKRRANYGVWSLLRRALKTPDGTCPYLIRQQRGLRLDADLLDSDVVQLDDVCNKLLFEQPGYGGWAYLFSQVNDKFSDDILPSENDNDALVGRRAECRDKLVDALVAASTRLVGAGEVREGLWFARAALQRDGGREDAYVALMEAQLGAGQRSAALETYFACRRYLVNELGIDPSIETTRLYRSIIESEEELE